MRISAGKGISILVKYNPGCVRMPITGSTVLIGS